MSPIGSHHAACVKYFNQFLQPFLGDQFLLSIQAPIQLGNLSEPEPDIALLKSQSDFYPARHPQANDVVAILEIADSSLNYDREVKTKLYAEAGIPEYYLINLSMQVIEVYLSPDPKGYQVRKQIKKGETFHFPPARGRDEYPSSVQVSVCSSTNICLASKPFSKIAVA